MAQRKQKATIQRRKGTKTTSPWIEMQTCLVKRNLLRSTKKAPRLKLVWTEVSKKQNDDHTSAGEAIRLHVKQNFSEISVEPEFEGEDVQPLAEISEDEEEQSSESDFDDGDNDDDDGANDSKASETVVMEGVAEEKARGTGIFP